MSEAALVDDNANLESEPDQIEEVESNAPEESAPQAEVEPTEHDSVQAKINKVTGRMYAEKREKEALQREIDSLRASQKVPEAKAPTLEDFDYDEAAFNAASISHQVKAGVAAESQRLQNAGIANSQAEVHQQREQAFNAQVAAVTASKPDYQDVVKQLPNFNQDTLDAIMGSDQGAELAYELGQKLDLADEIANSSPMVAAMKLGELSAQLKQKPNVKTSAAPSPIEPISAGGSLNKGRGPQGATFE